MENDGCCNENQIMKRKQAYIVILLWLLLWLLNTPYSICDIYNYMVWLLLWLLNTPYSICDIYNYMVWFLLWLLNTPYSICDIYIYMEEEINIYSTSPSTEIETAS